MAIELLLRRALSLLCACLLSLLVTCAQGRTELLVVVESNLQVGTELTQLDLQTFDADTGAVLDARLQLPLGDGPGHYQLPGSFLITREGAVSRPVSLDLRGTTNGCFVSRHTARVTLVPGQRTTYRAFLARECGAVVNAGTPQCDTREVVPCASDQSCTRGGVCVPSGSPPPDAVPSRRRASPLAGSPLAVAEDDQHLVAANRTVGSIAVFPLDASDYQHIHLGSRVDLWPDRSTNTEPWATVLTNDGDTAFVILRAAQQVVRINNLHGTPTLDARRAATGSEPTSLALTPSNSRLYVTNWGEGTVTVINTASMSVAGTVDLNGPLVQTGALGPISPREALAHPRALVITNTNSGDDAEQTAYITEFFSQLDTPPSITTSVNWNTSRYGVVYAMELRTHRVRALRISPSATSGLPNSAGEDHGCFPNQLTAAALFGSRLFLSGTCTSPEGPRGVDATMPAPQREQNLTNLHQSAVFTLDVSRRTAETQGRTYLLTQLFRQVYEQECAVAMPPASCMEAGMHRVPLSVLHLAFTPDHARLYLPAYGSDAVFRLEFGDGESLVEVGTRRTAAHYIDLTAGGFQGHLPAGFVPTNGSMSGYEGFTLDVNSRTISILNLNDQAVQSQVASADPPSPGSQEELLNLGRRLFVTGTDRMSLRGESHSSCESCHPDGRSDGVTWFFPRGPRQTPSLEGSYTHNTTPGTQRLFGWTANFDELTDLETVLRNTQGGVGALVHTASTPPSENDRLVYNGAMPTGTQRAAPRSDGLNGSSEYLAHSSLADPVAARSYDALYAFARSVRRVRRPTYSVGNVREGRRLFFSEGRCHNCHGGTLWTLSQRFYAPNTPRAGAPPSTDYLRATPYTLPMDFPPGLNPPAAATGSAMLFLGSTTDPSNDQVACVLRAVGTFPAVPVGSTAAVAGVAPTGVPVFEARENMRTLAQGATGYNPPSLLGLSVSAPYFHAGNARSLEELLVSPAFHTHLTAIGMNFSPEVHMEQVQNLVSFLLSLEEETADTSSLNLPPDRNLLLCPTTIAPP